MTEDPRSYNTPELRALVPEQIDNLGRAVIVSEFCIIIIHALPDRSQGFRI